MRIAIVINAERITAELSDKLNKGDLTTKYNLTYDLFVTPSNEIETKLRSLNYQTYNAIIIGGGDGTVRTAAQMLVDKDVPLAILPLGTFNMLAKELNYPNDIDALFDIVKLNKTKQIDLGVVNDHIFINHAWIGFYYRILKLRQKYATLLGKSKLFKLIFNVINFFKRLPVYELTLNVDNQVIKYTTCLIYIGNNDHYTNLIDFGERKTLSAGLLSVYILNCNTRWEVIKCISNILINNFKDSPYITQFVTDNLTITSHHKTINTVLDGELLQLSTPLVYTIAKKKLKVFTP